MKRIALITTLIITTSFIGGFWFANQEIVKLGGVPNVPSFNSVTTDSITANVGTSTVLLTKKGGRGYASICSNTNDRGYIQLNNEATTSAEYVSIAIPAYGCYEIDADNLYTGEVRFVPAAATTTVQVVEFIGQ